MITPRYFQFAFPKKKYYSPWMPKDGSSFPLALLISNRTQLYKFLYYYINKVSLSIFVTSQQCTTTIIIKRLHRLPHRTYHFFTNNSLPFVCTVNYKSWKIPLSSICNNSIILHIKTSSKMIMISMLFFCQEEQFIIKVLQNIIYP